MVYNIIYAYAAKKNNQDKTIHIKTYSPQIPIQYNIYIYIYTVYNILLTRILNVNSNPQLLLFDNFPIQTYTYYNNHYYKANYYSNYNIILKLKLLYMLTRILIIIRIIKSFVLL